MTRPTGEDEMSNETKAPQPPAEAQPSAPVGVEGRVKVLRELRDTGDVSDWRLLESALDIAIAALAQQPAAEARIYQCPRCATSLEVDPTAKPATVDEALSHADLCRLSRVFNAHNVPGLDQDRRINEWLGKRIAAALAAQPGGSDNDR